MRTTYFALLLALCAFTGASAQTLQSHVLTNYTSPFTDYSTQQMPMGGSEVKGDLIAAQWQLFPNPVRNAQVNVNLELMYETELEARIVSADGRVSAADRFSSLPQGLTSLQFELGDFPPGMYYLNLRNKDGMLTIPFVVSQ